ncbi:glycoside hydrolase family 43 protein [Mycena galopus ATCC 62051]|nr:glycoside hydrolase family 43 protein [Mycena galopus ATCC 62051]
MKLSTVLSTFLAAVVVMAQPNPLAGSSTVAVRDPSIWYNSASRLYYVFYTGNGAGMYTSPALTGPWTSAGSVLPSGCSVIPQAGNCNVWAPDVNFIDGLYTVYYAISELGSQNSAIGVATSPSMVAGTWTDLGLVINSVTGDVYNAIDPNIIDDDGLKLSFGSYWDGIYQIGIYPNVNDQASALPGTHLAGDSGRAAEGVFVYKPASADFYYCFFSNGTTPLIGATVRPPVGAEYRILVGRGASAEGPFYGSAGNPLTDPGTGTIVLASHDNIYAPGGQSVFADPVSGRDVMVYHYVPNNAFGGPSYLGINYLDFSTGWPVVVAA